ncbi:MAG: hypothetical protein U1F68_12785 [Gammaproteobacteria bacterium]
MNQNIVIAFTLPQLQRFGYGLNHASDSQGVYMNIINGNQAAGILYQFLNDSGLVANSPEILTQRDELLPQALDLLQAFHHNPDLDLATQPLPVQHFAVLLINLLLANLMQEAEVYSARLPENLSVRQQAAWLIGGELARREGQLFRQAL